MKSFSDIERFKRYQSVVNLLLSHESFQKPNVFEALKNEKAAFIGRIISELVKDGFLTNFGPKGNPQYSWSAKREEFNPSRWIDRRVFTTTIKRSPSEDRPRERLLRLAPSKLKTSELLTILIRSGLRGESAMQAGETLGLRILDHIILAKDKTLSMAQEKML